MSFKNLTFQATDKYMILFSFFRFSPKKANTVCKQLYSIKWPIWMTQV